MTIETCDNCEMPVIGGMLRVYDNSSFVGMSDMCSNCASKHAVKACDGHYWLKSDTQISACSRVITSEQIEDDEFILGKLTGQYWHHSCIFPFYRDSVDYCSGIDSAEYLSGLPEYFEHDGEYYHIDLRSELIAETANEESN